MFAIKPNPAVFENNLERLGREAKSVQNGCDSVFKQVSMLEHCNRIVLTNEHIEKVRNNLQWTHIGP